MSNTNKNVRSLRDKFQQQQANQYANLTKQEQKHDVLFQCIHCGRHQTVSLLLQSDITKDIVESPPVNSSSRDYDSEYQWRNVEQENRSSPMLRQENRASPMLRQETRSSPMLRQENRPSPMLRQEDRSSPILRQENRASPMLRQETRSSPMLRQENRPSPMVRQEDRSSPILRQENRASPMLRQETRSSPMLRQENRSSPTLRQVSTISEDQTELTPLVHRANYALDFRSTVDEKNSKKNLEQNVKGFVDGCVRSSVHHVSLGNREADTQDIVEVEIEYDPILGNIKSTRKRSSTIITNLDNDHRSTGSGNRHQSINSSRYQLEPSDAERDNAPIWARRRISHSTVKPSDLVREHDKKDKLDANALRRLSRTDLPVDSVIPNPTSKTTKSTQNPAMIKDTILRWCQELTHFYKGVNIRNFSSSWSDGLAFCAIIHRYFPDEFNFETLNANEPRQNFDLAFTVALERAGIEALIDTDDMLYMGSKPDSKVVFTYIQSLYRRLSRMQPPAVMRERW